MRQPDDKVVARIFQIKKMPKETATRKGEAEVKAYKLLPSMAPVAPIFIVASGKRFRIDTLQRWKPNLQYTFENASGDNITVRFKRNANSILQSEQIEKGIPANERFDAIDRNSLVFINGLLMTKSKLAQTFLESIPHFDGFDGVNYDQSVRPAYTIYSKAKEEKEENDAIKLTFKAMGYILKLDLEEARTLLIKVRGAGYTPSKDLAEVQNDLTRYMDDSLENTMEIAKIADAKGDTDDNVDDKAKLLIGQLIDKEVLSFVALENQVSVFKNNEWRSLKEISSIEYDLEQRVQLFADFLNSDQGKPVLDSLTETLNGLTKSKR